MTETYYDEEKVKKATLNYFSGDELATQVWMTKYALVNNEGNFLELTPLDTFKRISTELFRIESSYSNPLSFDTILNLFINKYFILGGSNLFGIGNNYSLSSLGNCFVLPSSKDSYSNILQTDAEQVQIMKRRGGVGHDLSLLRPAGTEVHNSAKTSTGATSFMKRFSESTKEVAQDGRRGALMLTMEVTHPDILKFIESKDDVTKLTGANISVKITDEFIEALSDNTDFPLNFMLKSGEQLVYLVKARTIWEKLIYQSWKNGEPGVLFWDRIIEESPADYYKDYKTISTNPCFSGEERLKTIVFGEQKFKDLVGKTVYIYNENGYSAASIWYSGRKDTVTFRNGLGETTTCTPDHIWRLNNGTECMAKNLKGKKLMPYTAIYHPQIWSELYMKLGFIQGDGELNRLNDIKYPNHKGFTVNIGKNDTDILNLFGYKRTTENQKKWYTSEFYNICKKLQFSEKPLPNRILPLTFNSWQPLLQQSFLRGLYSANGSIITGHRISFKSTCKDFILQLQEVLKKFNINSYYTTYKNHLVKFDNGEYECKTSYDLNISQYNSILAFHQNIGFIHEYKTNNLVQLIIYKSPVITSVKPSGVQDVYDFSEPITNWGAVNGYLAHNCSELPLSAYDSCRLGSLILPTFVHKPFTPEAVFDEDTFIEMVQISQRLMDDVVDLEEEKIDAILTKVTKESKTNTIEKDLWNNIKQTLIGGRRTGLGFLGLADTLAMLNISYNDPKAIDFSEHIAKLLAINSYKTSIKLSKERGAFPKYSNHEQSHTFIRKIMRNQSTEIVSLYNEYGRRNIANLTIPPTGSIAMISQVSSGIEPVFNLSYTRRKKAEPNPDKKQYQDEDGIWWEEYPVLHHGLEQWKRLQDKSVDLDKNPYKGSTANEIDPFHKVKLQSRIQYWIDHSISVTYNLPENTTPVDIEKLMLFAWESGCKGLTVYREGSRHGILINKKTFPQYDSIKRPKIIECDVFVSKAQGKIFTVLIGKVEDKPYEIFAFEDNSIKIKTGFIRKVKKGHYNLLYDNKEICKENITGNMTQSEEDRTRMISTALRHGTPIQYIVEQLYKSKSDITSFSKAIARTLNRYSNTIRIDNIICPKCKTKLIMEGGCSICPQCGYSKCL